MAVGIRSSCALKLRLMPVERGPEQPSERPQAGAVPPGAVAFVPAAFRPPWWARSGLMQTVLASMGSRRHVRQLRLERWRMPDGDFVRLHFAPRQPEQPAAPLVLLLHGLEGSRESACTSGR